MGCPLNPSPVSHHPSSHEPPSMADCLPTRPRSIDSERGSKFDELQNFPCPQVERPSVGHWYSHRGQRRARALGAIQRSRRPKIDGKVMIRGEPVESASTRQATLFHVRQWHITLQIASNRDLKADLLRNNKKVTCNKDATPRSH